MHRPLFLRILRAVQREDEYFTIRCDATGLAGLGPLQKVCAALCILAYGLPTDAVDEYIQIGQTTARDCLIRFCRAIISSFSERYLRIPNHDDIARILRVNADRGFPGMLGSIDCMHWEWRNCPTAWRGQFCGRNSRPTMILEAVAGYDLWIWHAFFGMPGTNNDLNVLHRSPVFDPLRNGTMPPVHFTINGTTYNFGYYLADGIYPNWPTFVKAIRHTFEEKKVHFTTKQESCRKDIERAFGVLQARWAVLRGPAYGWDRNHLAEMMTACIIMHNMIVEDEGDGAANVDFIGPTGPPEPCNNTGEGRNEWLNNHIRSELPNDPEQDITCQATYLSLQHNLVEHLWARRGAMG